MQLEAHIHFPLRNMQGKSLLVEFIVAAPQREPWQQELQQHCSLRTADMGKGMIRYLGYCAKKPKQAARHSMHCTKTLHGLETEGAVCNLGGKSLTLNMF